MEAQDNTGAQYTSPGIPHIKVMIWEPQPISLRPLQDVNMVHSEETIKQLPNDIRQRVEAFGGSPESIYMRPKYQYRNTWLLLPGNALSVANADGTISKVHIAQKSSYLQGYWKTQSTTPPYATIPCLPEVGHQTFLHIGSIFNTTPSQLSSVYTPPASSQNSSLAIEFDLGFNTGLPQWSYTEQAVSSDGVVASPNPITNCDPPTRQFGDTRIICPSQDAVSVKIQDYSGSASSSSASINPIHWLAEKQLPIFQGESFFVEFFHGAERHDTVDIIQNYYNLQSNPLTANSGSDYYTMNPSDNLYDDVIGNIAVNQAVIQLKQDGTIDSNSTRTYDLSVQPYYLIDIGGPSEPHHRYVIIIAANGPPIFAHIGVVPMPNVDPTAGLTIQNVGTVSRCLSRYDISGNSLLQQDRLRVTVRHHLGRMVVIFSGHEDKPWIIERYDYVANNGAPAGSSNPQDFKDQFVPMITPNKPIRIGGGNMKVSWCFSILTYEETMSFTNPNVIVVRGPVTDCDVSLLLREKQNQNIRGLGAAPRYFQSADVYYEVVNGRQDAATVQSQVTDPSLLGTLTAPDRGIVTSAFPPTTKNGNKASFIRVHAQSSLPQAAAPQNNSVPAAGNGNTGTPDVGELASYFYAQYSMGSGDYTFDGPGPSPLNIGPWTVKNCITPISTGWRVFVPTGGYPTNPNTGIDVTQHVLSYNSTWSYTDDTRVDHNGSINFYITSNMHVAPGTKNYADYIASLTNKQFFIRVYGWWTGGFMQCGEDCSCGSGKPYQCAIFTGFCQGGEITVQAGKRIMACQLVDYWKILSDSKFLNSPFYDGMRDYNAVYDILTQIGFVDGNSNGDYASSCGEQQQYTDPWHPMDVISQQANYPGASPFFVSGPNNTVVYSNEFALPSAYDILQNPFMRFGDGSQMDEAIMRIVTLSGKVAYFDRFGVFHMDIRPDIQYNQGILQPKATFYASPVTASNAQKNAFLGGLVPGLGTKCQTLARVALDQYAYKRAIADAVNEIQILSASPDGSALIGNAGNDASKYNTQAEGYIGYVRRLLQIDGIFGSIEAVYNVIQYYKGFFIPPVIVTFTGWGDPSLQAMDIITFRGLVLDQNFPGGTTNNTSAPQTVDLVITSLTHDITIDDSKVEWRSKFETEWLFTGPLATPPT